MKKIKYLIFGLLLGCLGLTSFSSAYNVSCENNQTFSLTGFSAVYFNDIICDNSNQCFAQIIDSSNNNIVQQVQFSVFINEVSLSESVLLPSGDYFVSLDRVDYCSLTVDSVPSCPTCPSCEDCSSIQESLSGCLEDYDSVSNMNQSLSDELEACLSSGGDGCNPETDTGCVEGAIMPLLSWSVGLDSFSTPIINNLTLPTNYKGKLVDGVLSISSINQNLSIDDSDYGNIKDSFVNIVLYIFGVGLMLILVYYIKFYFFNIKD